MQDIPNKSRLEQLLWMKKYSPAKISDLTGRSDLIKSFESFTSQGNIPHLLFSGPEGYGKTTAAILLAKAILKDSFSSNFKIVYADDPLTSAERDYVKKNSYVSESKLGSSAGHKFSWPAFIFARIKPFVEIKPIGFAPFKILVIKDFEKLGTDQQGFRRLMERYSKTCRMILITKEISSVIDPILSRCSIFFFNEIKFEPFKELIMNIKENEKLEFKGNIPKALYLLTNGRIGESIHLLQTASMNSTIINSMELQKKYNDRFQRDMEEVLKKLFDNDLNSCQSLIIKNLSRGHGFKDIITQISENIFKLPIQASVKALLIIELSDIDFESLDGNDLYISSEFLLYRMQALIKKLKSLEN